MTNKYYLFTKEKKRYTNKHDLNNKKLYYALILNKRKKVY